MQLDDIIGLVNDLAESQNWEKLFLVGEIRVKNGLHYTPLTLVHYGKSTIKTR